MGDRTLPARQLWPTFSASTFAGGRMGKLADNIYRLPWAVGDRLKEAA
jgi:hypothetical protein